MSSDSNPKDSEEFINLDYSVRGRQEALQAEVTQEAKELTDTQQAKYLSKAVVKLGFSFIEIGFGISALVMMSVTATTSLPLFKTSASLMAIAAFLEIVKRFIVNLDGFFQEHE